MSDNISPDAPGTAELAQPEAGDRSMIAATCMQCLKPFTRLPKSVAAYCSPRCRSDAKEGAAAVEHEKWAAPLAAIINAGPPEVTDISVVTYREYQIVWTQTESGFLDGKERTCAVRSFGSLPSHVLMALVEKAPDLIPDEVMSFAPDDPLNAIQCYVSHPWWNEVVTPDPINKDNHE